MFHNLEYICSSNPAGSLSGEGYDMYSEGTGFEYQLGNRLS